jgi:hypothetical protein
LRVLAGESLFQRQVEIVAKVGAALLGIAALAATAAAAGHEVAENVVEDLRHRGGEIASEAVRAAAMLEGRVAEAVIGGALLRVLEALIGLADLLELQLRGGVAGIAVRVELHRQLAIGDLEGLLVAALGNAKDLVEIALRHLCR